MSISVIVFSVLALAIGIVIVFFISKHTSDKDAATNKEDTSSKKECIVGDKSERNDDNTQTEETENMQGKVEEEKEDKKQVIPEEFNKINEDELKEIITKEIEKLGNEYGMDYDETKELINEVIEQIKESKNEIYQKLDGENWEELERIIHGLKGATLNSKFNTIGKRFEYILNYIREKHPNVDKEFLKVLIDNTYQTLEKIIKII